jgi:hypothetical protein
MRHHSPNCLNCGEATPGEYCGACGQRNVDLRASFWELLVDIFSEAFEADSRIGRTIVPFLFKPGFLTNEHNSGRRVRYSSPLRLYLFASTIFFLSASFSVSRAKLEIYVGAAADGGSPAAEIENAFARRAIDAGAIDNDAGVAGGAAVVQGVAVDDAGGGALDGGTSLQLAVRDANDAGESSDAGDVSDAEDAGVVGTALAQVPPAPDRDGGFSEHDGGSVDAGVRATHPTRQLSPLARALELDRIGDQLKANLERLAAAQRSESPESEQLRKRAMEAIVENIPRLMFLFVPLVALLFKLFFRRRHAWYTEHLTMVFHLHAFAFLLLAIVTLPIPVPDSVAAAAMAIALILSWLYTLLAIRRVYSQGWIATTLKFLTLSLIYLVMLGVGLGAVVLLGVIQL